ncbi:hypothetical protein, partial [Jannaschia formosa]|uniref:hypothetical protein n=1 Tax=Jannaschia formosa TaxID=2259592 RepID=UPI001ADDA82E
MSHDQGIHETEIGFVRHSNTTVAHFQQMWLFALRGAGVEGWAMASAVLAGALVDWRAERDHL